MAYTQDGGPIGYGGPAAKPTSQGPLSTNLGGPAAPKAPPIAKAVVGPKVGDPCDPNAPPTLSPSLCPGGQFPKCRDDTKKIGCKWDFVRDNAAAVTARGGSPLVGGAGYGAGFQPGSSGSGGAISGVGGGFNTGLYNLERDKFDDLYGRLGKIMSGSETRFNPEVVAGLDADAKLNQSATNAQQSQEISEDAASRGLTNTGMPVAAAARARQDSSAQFGAATRNTRVQKAMYDFQDKFDAIKQAGDQLDRLHQYALGLQQDSTQRESIQAQLTLGRENIQAALQQLKLKLASDKELQSAVLSSNEWQTIYSSFNNPVGY